MKKNKFESTPLHIACMRGNIDAVQLLVHRGASVQCTNMVYSFLHSFPFFKYK